MESRIESRVDVSGVLPTGTALELSIDVFLPDRPAAPSILLFCLPGGTYTKGYWSLEVDGRDGYSFAEEMTRRGYVVAAADWLGVGASSQVDDGAALTIEVLSAANDIALRATRAGIVDGSIAGRPLQIDHVVGVGHSGGAMLTVYQQGMHQTSSAVALLGFTDQQRVLSGVPSGAPPPESVDGFYTSSRSRTRSVFFLDDVPEDVIEADERQLTARLPAPILELTRRAPFLEPQTSRITVPVFLGFGERDTSPDPAVDVGRFSASPDVTRFILNGSAHCHNMASTRMLLWSRLDLWMRSVLLGAIGG